MGRIASTPASAGPGEPPEIHHESDQAASLVPGALTRRSEGACVPPVVGLHRRIYRRYECRDRRFAGEDR